MGRDEERPLAGLKAVRKSLVEPKQRFFEEIKLFLGG
jgi:hypothetical protein